MSFDVTITDYGSGNIYSVSRALETCGGNIRLTADPVEIASAERLVVPGVGAFEAVMGALSARGLDDAIRCFAETGRPLLGICVGMQMMLSYSEEFGHHPGFGFIPGKVTAIPGHGADGTPHPVPHIGWNGLQTGGRTWDGTLLSGTQQGTAFYFVHSFAAAPENPNDVLATCDYDGHAIVAAVVHDNMVGVQFHPEKSGPAGLAVLESFLNNGCAHDFAAA